LKISIREIGNEIEKQELLKGYFGNNLKRSGEEIINLHLKRKIGKKKS